MKTQINSDNQVAVDAELSKTVEADVRRALGTFETRLTRLEVHLSDLSSGNRGLRDKRCLLEARPIGRKPVSVSFEAASVEQAVRGAARKMKRLLDTSFGKSQSSQRSTRQTKGDSSSSASLGKLQRIQAALSEIFEDATRDSPRLERCVTTAIKALNEARLIVESRSQEKGVRASKRTSTPVKEFIPVPQTASADGRSRKKKAIYRARRKAWPGR